MVPLASPSSMALSENCFYPRGDTGVKTDCKWSLIRFASVGVACKDLVGMGVTERTDTLRILARVFRALHRTPSRSVTLTDVSPLVKHHCRHQSKKC